METILVTGGAGFIGSHVCDALLEKEKKVVCLDNFNDYYDPEKKKKNIEHNLKKKNFSVEKVDITNFDDLKKVFQKYKIDKMIHLAARAGVRPSIEQPRLYFKVNIQGTLNLLELCKEFNIKTFIFGSSSSVYGNNKKIPFSESDITENQISPYASSKKAGEQLCRMYSKFYDINITCLRFFTVYGPRGRPDMAPYKFTKLIYKDKPITMYGDGTSKRDYTFIADIVSGILSATEKQFKFEIINLGNSDPIQLKEFIEIIESILEKKAVINQKEMPPGDVDITYADISKAKKLLNYDPSTDIKTGMKKFIKWYKKNN